MLLFILFFNIFLIQRISVEEAILKLQIPPLPSFKIIAFLPLTQMFVAVAILNTFELSDVFETCSPSWGHVMCP